MESNLESEIRIRGLIDGMVKRYYEELLDGFGRLIEDEVRGVMDEVDRRVFGRKFMDIYVRY